MCQLKVRIVPKIINWNYFSFISLFKRNNLHIYGLVLFQKRLNRKLSIWAEVFDFKNFSFLPCLGTLIVRIFRTFKFAFNLIFLILRNYALDFLHLVSNDSHLEWRNRFRKVFLMYSGCNSWWMDDTKMSYHFWFITRYEMFLRSYQLRFFQHVFNG